MAEKDTPETNQSTSSQTGEGGAAQRRSRWRSSLDAVAYIYRLARQPELKIRETDRTTGFALILASFAATLCLLLHNLSGLSLQLTLLADFFLGLSLTIYIFNRLGIITSLQPRQAILVWHLITAFCFVGVFITINLALIFSLALSVTPISTFKILP